MRGSEGSEGGGREMKGSGGEVKGSEGSTRPSGSSRSNMLSIWVSQMSVHRQACVCARVRVRVRSGTWASQRSVHLRKKSRRCVSRHCPEAEVAA